MVRTSVCTLTLLLLGTIAVESVKVKDRFDDTGAVNSEDEHVERRGVDADVTAGRRRRAAVTRAPTSAPTPQPTSHPTPTPTKSLEQKKTECESQAKSVCSDQGTPTFGEDDTCGCVCDQGFSGDTCDEVASKQEMCEDKRNVANCPAGGGAPFYQGKDDFSCKVEVLALKTDLACNNAGYCECDAKNKRKCKEGWEGHCACKCSAEYATGPKCQDDSQKVACTLCGASETAAGTPCACKAKHNMPYETETNCRLASGVLSVPVAGKILYHLITGAKVVFEALIFTTAVPAFLRTYINDAVALITGFLDLKDAAGEPIKLQISQWAGPDDQENAEEIERRIQPDSDEMQAAKLLGNEMADAITPNSGDVLDGVRLFSTMLAR